VWATSPFKRDFAEELQSEKLREESEEHLHGEVTANFERIKNRDFQAARRVICVKERDQRRQPPQTLSIFSLNNEHSAEDDGSQEQWPVEARQESEGQSK
jgi:hypothetical protein